MSAVEDAGIVLGGLAALGTALFGIMKLASSSESPREEELNKAEPGPVAVAVPVFPDWTIWSRMSGTKHMVKKGADIVNIQQEIGLIIGRFSTVLSKPGLSSPMVELRAHNGWAVFTLLNEQRKCLGSVRCPVNELKKLTDKSDLITWAGAKHTIRTIAKWWGLKDPEAYALQGITDLSKLVTIL